MPTDAVRGAHCAGCGEFCEDDGRTAGVVCGRFLCLECSRDEIAFEAECLDCGWTHRVEGTESQRYHLRQRVQQEKNNHEKEKRVFDDESHDAAWRELEVAS